MLTGRVVRLGEDKGSGPAGVLKRLIARSGEPFIRQALRQAMRILGDNFVLGRTIEEALRPRRATTRRRAIASPSTCWASGPRRAADAERYFDRYMAAIEAIGKAAGPPSAGDVHALMARPSVSVKLSAIHPRFDPGKEAAARRASCCRASSSWPPPRAGTASASPSTRRSRTGST